MNIKGTENSRYILENIGNEIRTTRIDKALSQKDLANLSGVSFSTITRLEQGESVSLENFIKVLKALELANNLNLVIPEKKEIAESIWNPVKKRKRVSSKQKEEQNEIEWEWGDKE